MGRTVEVKATANTLFIRHQEFDIEPKIRDLSEIALKHCPIPGQPDILAVVLHIIVNKCAKIVPILTVQTINVSAVNLSKIRNAHTRSPVGYLSWGRIPRSHTDTTTKPIPYA